MTLNFSAVGLAGQPAGELSPLGAKPASFAAGRQGTHPSDPGNTPSGFSGYDGLTAVGVAFTACLAIGACLCRSYFTNSTCRRRAKVWPHDKVAEPPAPTAEAVPPPLGMPPPLHLVLPNCEAQNGRRSSETREEYAYRVYSDPVPPVLSIHRLSGLHVPVDEEEESIVYVTEDGKAALQRTSDNTGFDVNDASGLASADVCLGEGPSLYKLGRAEKEAWIGRLLGRAEKQAPFCCALNELEASFTSTAATSVHFREGASFCVEEEASLDGSEMFREGPSYLLNEDADFDDLESGSSCSRLREGPSFLLE